MNRPFSSFLALCATLLLCFQLASAQQANPNSSDNDAKAALRAKAYELLASLADQLGALQSPENRARIGSNIAGSLWTHDEKRARALFKLVEDDIRLGMQVDKGDPKAEHTFQVFFKLRENTAERMAQHDPELALAFVRDTASFVNEYARRPDGEIYRPIAEQERQLELRLAKKIGATNPEIAIKLARQSLASGFSNDLLTVLRRSSKNKALTSELYKEIVTKLRDADFEDWQTLDFAQRLAQSYTPPVVDEAAFRELINIFVTKAIAGGCAKQSFGEHDEAPAFCSSVAVLFPVIEKFYPLEARRLAQWKPEDRDYRFDLQRGYAEINELVENGTIDEVLELTSKYPEFEVNIRMRALWMAQSAGDLETAEKIVRGYNGDPQIRHVLNERLSQLKDSIPRTEEQWVETRKNIERLPQRVQVSVLLKLARDRATRDKKMSFKVLAHVGNLIDTLPPGSEQTLGLIQMAAGYCLAGSDRGFAIVEGLLPKLNELVAAGAKLDGYDARYLREGEWNMTGEGAVGNILTVLANNAGAFALLDFDRAVTLAAQFERSEIRMMGQLKLAQGILGPANNQ